MEQIAVVKKVLENGMAQIAVERETACGAAHSCADCAGCEKMMTNTHTVPLLMLAFIGAYKNRIVNGKLKKNSTTERMHIQSLHWLYFRAFS